MLPDSLVPIRKSTAVHVLTFARRRIDRPAFYIYQIKISHNFPLFVFFFTAFRRSLIWPVAPRARKHAPLTTVHPFPTTPRPSYVFIPCAPPAAVTIRRVQCNRVGSRPLDVRRFAGADGAFVPSQPVPCPYRGRPASSAPVNRPHVTAAKRQRAAVPIRPRVRPATSADVSPVRARHVHQVQ